VSSIDYFVRVHGQDALVALIGSYADGKTDDEAFTAAIGQDVDTFNAAWLAELGAAVPNRFGPQPAPHGPLPPGWVGEPGAPTAPSAPPDRPMTGVVLAVVAVFVIVIGGFALYARRRQRSADA
jgi:hypothetical protein